MKRLFVLIILLLLAFSSISYGWRDGRGPQVQGGPGVETDPWSIHLTGLTANWDAGAYTITGLRFISDIVTGTAPFTVASTTVVANLNASYLEGNAASYFAIAADYIRKDGTVGLTGNWDAGPYTITGTRFISDIATGTAPFGVTSTTVVANLNASYLEGNAASYFAIAADYIKKDGSVGLTSDWDAGSYRITAQTFTSDVVTGTAPIIVASTTVVDNLNADLLDGNSSAYFATDSTVLKKDGTVGLTGDWVAGQTITTDLIQKGLAGYDVRAYGATGDGVTDDTAAIQAAIDDSTDGGTIFFPEGTYNITTVNVDELGLILQGVGTGSTIIEVQTASDRKGLNISVDRVCIRDMTVQSSGDVTDGNDLIGIYYEDPSTAGAIGYGVIENVRCVDFSLAGIYIINSIYFTGRNISANGCLNGLYFTTKDGSHGTTFNLDGLYLTKCRDNARAYTVTADAGSDIITGATCTEMMPVVFSTTDTLPDPLVAGDIYFATTISGNTFQVNATPGAASVVDITDAGSGTHTATQFVGSGIYMKNTVRGTISNLIVEYSNFGIFMRGSSAVVIGGYFEAITTNGYDCFSYDSRYLKLGEVHGEKGTITYWRGAAVDTRYNTALDWLDLSTRDVTAQRNLDVTGTAILAGANTLSGATNVTGGLTETGASPEHTLANTTEEDTHGGRESSIIATGEQSGGEETTLGKIEFSHQGAEDDEDGQICFSTNDGDDDTSPHLAVTINSDQQLVAHKGTVVADLSACARTGSVGYFNGGDCLDASTNDISIGFWVKNTITSGYYNSAIAKFSFTNNTKGYGITIPSGQPCFLYNDGTLTTSAARHLSGKTINDGYWHHVAGVWDRDGDLTGYIDGKLVLTVAINATDIDNAQDFKVGAGAQKMVGSIQDVRIYIASGDCWSAAEIATMFESRMDNSSGESLTSSWLFDDSPLATVIDDAQVADNDLAFVGGTTTNFYTHTKAGGTGLVTVDAAGKFVTTKGAITVSGLDTTFNGAVDMSTPWEDVYYVAKSGGDYTSIQTALNAHTSGGETFLIAPGSYTDTINFTASNQCVRGIGTTAMATVTQVDAAVVNFGAWTGCHISDLKITMSAPSTAKDMITGSGSLSLRSCHLTVTSSAALAQLQQPAAIYTTGTVKQVWGTLTYDNSGVCTGGIKAPVRLGASGVVELRRVSIDVDGSNAALGTTIAYEAAGVTAECKMYRCTVDVTDATATVVSGSAYLVGTGTTHEVFGNVVHVTAGAGNTGYGYYVDGTTTIRSMLNHIHIVDAGGTSYSYMVDTGCALVSQFDDFIADDGEGTINGTVTKANSESDGNFEASGEVISSNEDWIPIAEFSPTGDGSSNAVATNRYADGTNRRMYNRTLGSSDTQDMDWYAEKAVIKTPTSLTLYTRASDYTNCAMTMQVWDQSGNADATGAVTITPTANDTWQEKTYTFTSAYTNDEELWIKVAITSLDTADTIDFGRSKVIY